MEILGKTTIKIVYIFAIHIVQPPTIRGSTPIKIAKKREIQGKNTIIQQSGT